jgi:hypothetical protein
VEVDGVHEVLPVAKTARCVLHPLDLRVERFAARIGDAVALIGDDVLEARPSAMQKEVSIVIDNFQARTRRLNQSTIAAR